MATTAPAPLPRGSTAWTASTSARGPPQTTPTPSRERSTPGRSSGAPGVPERTTGLPAPTRRSKLTNQFIKNTRKMFYKGHLIRATLLTTKCLIKLLQSYVNKAHFVLAHRDSSLYLSNMRTFGGHLRLRGQNWCFILGAD